MTRANVVEIGKRYSSLEEEARVAAGIANRIRNGDVEAESELVDRYSRGLRYLLARRIGDDERARDLLQDTLCIAIEKIRTRRLDDPERLAGYLRGIAVRVALNAGRQRNKEPYSIGVQATATIPDDQPRQFQQISKAETVTAVRKLLQLMPVDRDKDLLVRLYVYDQDRSEICRALGLSSLHFNRVLYRAKNRFRALLEETGICDDLVPTNDD